MAKLSEATTVQGQTVGLSTAGGVKVNDASVVDTVILPRNWTGTDRPGHGASDPGWSLVVR